MEKFRTTDFLGIVKDVVIIKGDIIKKGLSCIVNLPEFVECNYGKYQIIEDKIFTNVTIGLYDIEGISEESDFVKLEHLNKLFYKAKEIVLMKAITIFNHSNDKYSCDIVYLKIDDLFTELIFSSREDVLTDDKGIEYVYVYQSDCVEDLSLNLFKKAKNLYCKEFSFNKKIQSKYITEEVFQSYFDDYYKPEDCIGIDLEELISYSFKNEANNIRYGSGLLLNKKKI